MFSFFLLFYLVFKMDKMKIILTIKINFFLVTLLSTLFFLRIPVLRFACVSESWRLNLQILMLMVFGDGAFGR